MGWLGPLVPASPPAMQQLPSPKNRRLLRPAVAARLLSITSRPPHPFFALEHIAAILRHLARLLRSPYTHPSRPIPLFHPFPFPITASAHLSKVRPRCLCRVDTLNGDQRLVGPRVPLSALVSEDPAFRVETGRQLARRHRTGL
jgi:hypothetical protein